MKICIDARLVLNKVTGIGYYLTNLIDTLAKVDNHNTYTIFLNKRLATDHPLRTIRKDNLRFVPVATKAVGPGQQFLMPFRLWRENFDVYHYPHFDLPLLQNKPSIITIHDLKYIMHPSFFPELGKMKRIYMEQTLRIATKRAKHIIAVSESTKKSLIERFHVPPQKVTTIWLAPPRLEKANAVSKELRADWIDKNLNTKYLLFIGERRPHKNIIRMIEALKIFTERNKSDYRFFIVGPRYSNYSAPEDKIQELGLDDKVKILGYISDTEKTHLLKNAELFIFSSLYEGFGIPILEAMAHGIPVITSNITSMPEVAGDAALLVNPNKVEEIAEAMERVIHDQDLRTEMIRKGFENIARFSWDKSAENTLAVYQEVHANAEREN